MLHGIAVVHMCVELIPEVEPEPAMLVLASKDGWCGSQCMFTAESGQDSRRKGRVTISMKMGREGISPSCSGKQVLIFECRSWNCILVFVSLYVGSVALHLWLKNNQIKSETMNSLPL